MRRCRRRLAFGFWLLNFRQLYFGWQEVFPVASGLKQTTAGSIFILVNESAIPSQLVRAPPNDAEQDQAQNKCGMNSHQVKPGRRRQCQTINRRASGAFFNPDSRNEHHGHDKPEHHPAHTADGFSLEKNFDQKKTQAADQQHDQHRADADHEIVGKSFVWFEGGHDHLTMASAQRFITDSSEFTMRKSMPCASNSPAHSGGCAQSGTRSLSKATTTAVTRKPRCTSPPSAMAIAGVTCRNTGTTVASRGICEAAAASIAENSNPSVCSRRASISRICPSFSLPLRVSTPICWPA